MPTGFTDFVSYQVPSNFLGKALIQAFGKEGGGGQEGTLPQDTLLLVFTAELIACRVCGGAPI